MKVKLFIIAAIVLLAVCACEEDQGKNPFVGTWEGPLGTGSYDFSDDKAALSSEYKVTYNNLSGALPASGTYTFDGNTAEISFDPLTAFGIPPFTGKRTATIVGNSFEISAVPGIPITFTKK